MRRADRRANCLAIASPLAVLTTTRSPRRIGAAGEDHDHVAVSIAKHRFHGLARNLQRVGVRVADLGNADLIPAGTDRVAAHRRKTPRLPPVPCRSKECALTLVRFEAMARAPVTRWEKISRLAPVASCTFARLSVLGQRLRPSGIRRFDGLKVVGSSPDRRARPDADIPCSAASVSKARQISSCLIGFYHDVVRGNPPVGILPSIRVILLLYQTD